MRRDDEMQYFAERAMNGFGLFDATGDNAEQGLELSRFSESMADYLNEVDIGDTSVSRRSVVSERSDANDGESAI